MDIKTLREKRAKIVADMRALLDTAKKADRDLTKEESELHDKLFDKQEDCNTQIRALERQVELDRAMAETAAQEAEQRAAAENTATGTTEQQAEQRALREIEGYRAFLVGNDVGVTEEFRALQADADLVGGFLVAPMQFVQQLIKKIDDAVFIRGLATVMPVANAESLGVPSLENDPADADWTSEILTGSEDSTMDFGRRELHPHPLAKLIKASNKLLRVSVIPAEQLIMARLAYKFGISEEKGFLTGSGSGQPLGVYTASSNGISTARDVSTGNTTTSIQMDGLKEAKYTLKGAYWPNARWNFHRDAVKQISKLQDGQGRYYWEPMVRGSDPDRILGFPFDMSEYAPNTFTTGLYVGMLADFSHYWIADSMQMQVQRLVELYAATNQTGFIGRLETDGMPVLEEAFVRVKLA